MIHPEDVIERLASGPALISGLIESVPPKDLRRRPQPGKWSAHEHACHLAVMEPMWRTRLELILREDSPDIVSYGPEDEDPDRLLAMNLDEAIKDFERDRRTFVDRLRSLPPEAWQRTATHTAHSRYSLFLMCRHMAMHDGLHGYRIEESALGSHWPNER